MPPARMPSAEIYVNIRLCRTPPLVPVPSRVASTRLPLGMPTPVLAWQRRRSVRRGGTPRDNALYPRAEPVGVGGQPAFQPAETARHRFCTGPGIELVRWLSGRASPTMTTNRVRGAATSAYQARPAPESRTWPSCSSPRTPESAHPAPPATGCARRHLRNRTLPGAPDRFPPDRPEHLTPQGRLPALRRRMSDPALRPPWPRCPRVVLTPNRTVRPRSDRHPAAATGRFEPRGVRQAEA